MIDQMQKVPLFWLSKSMLNPKEKRTFLRNLVFIILFSAMVISFVQVHMELVLNFRGLETFTKYMDISGAFIQTFGKIIFLLYHRKNVLLLLEMTQKFWINKMDHNLLKTVGNIPFYYSCLAPLNMLLYALYPLLRNTKKLLWICYGEQNGFQYPEYEILYFQQVVVMFFIVFSVLGFDTLFAHFIGIAIGEARAIRKTFMEYSTKPSSDDRNEIFKDAYNHHCNLLKYVGVIESSYNGLIFVQYLVTLLSVTFQLFILSSVRNDMSLLHVMKYTYTAITFTIQVGVFCYAGHLITFEFATIADDLSYMDSNGKIACSDKFKMIMVMQRTQKLEYLTIGGFLGLNLISFISLLRRAASFYTVLRILGTRN